MNHHPSNWRVLVTPIENFSFERKIFLGQEESGGRIFAIAQPLVLEARENGAPITAKPFFQGQTREVEAFMQALMDAGWEMGLRPRGLEEPTNELKAVRDHLSDMRVIVESRLEVKLKP